MKIENGIAINQYRILSPLGKGGMGEVFLAQDTRLDRKVALKILPAEFSEDKDRMSRFVREAKSRRIKHLNPWKRISRLKTAD